MAIALYGSNDDDITNYTSILYQLRSLNTRIKNRVIITSIYSPEAFELLVLMLMIGEIDFFVFNGVGVNGKSCWVSNYK